MSVGRVHTYHEELIVGPLVNSKDCMSISSVGGAHDKSLRLCAHF